MIKKKTNYAYFDYCNSYGTSLGSIHLNFKSLVILINDRIAPETS